MKNYWKPEEYRFSADYSQRKEVRELVLASLAWVALIAVAVVLLSF
jgi:hypothetical protein